MTIGTSILLWSIQGSQRALGHLKVCTHWAGTNRLPAALLVGQCVSRAQVPVISGQTAAVSFCGHVTCRYVCPWRDPFSARLRNNKLCLRQLYLYFQDQNMRMTCLLWPYVARCSQAAAKEGIEEEGGCEISSEGWCQEAGSDYSSILHARLLFFLCAELLDLVKKRAKRYYSSLGSAISLILSWNNWGSWGVPKSHNTGHSEITNHLSDQSAPETVIIIITFTHFWNITVLWSYCFCGYLPLPRA